MRLRVAGTLVVLLAVALQAGCGANSTDKPKVQLSQAAAPRQQQPPPPPDYASEARSALRAYYAALNNLDFGRAWSYLGPEPRSQTSGYANWRGGYATTVWSKPRGLSVVSQSPDQVVISGSLAAYDVDACDNDVHQRFAGSWTLSPRASGRWIATDITLDKVSGGTPILDASACAPAPTEPAQSEQSVSSCDPNYVGACLDPSSSDYDCEGGSGDGPDYTGPVQVVGDDHFGLDRDGDGDACAS